MSKHTNERLKVVVRNLPPTLAKDAFVSTIDKHVEGTYNWLAYYAGKVSLKRTVFSKAFINFNSPDAVFEFKARFDGHVFVSTRGTQYRCCVEYAPFQKVPTANPKKLAMEGTIEKDPDYQAFVQALDEGPKALPTAQAQLEAQEAARSAEEAGPVVTALMAFLQKKYESTPFTGRRGSKGSRSRREIVREAIIEEDDNQGASAKAVKGRGKSGGRSRPSATEPDVAATAAAAAGAASQALKGTRQKQNKAAKGLQQPEQPAVLLAKPTKADRKHGSKAAPSKDEAAAADRVETSAKGEKPSRRTAAAAGGSLAAPAAAAASSSKAAALTSSTVTGTPAAAAAAASEADDEESKRTAAAALAAASAANAAAAAARKSRVKAGHQIYTPGAGGRLFAAALGTAKTAERSSARGGSSSAAGTAKRAAQEPSNELASDAVATGAGGNVSSSVPAATAIVKQAGSAAKQSKPARRPVAAVAGAESTLSSALPAAGLSGIKASSKGDEEASVAMSKLQDDASGSATAGKGPAHAASSSSSSRGGRGGRAGRSGSHGRHQQEQHQWVPKSEPG